MDQTWSNNQSQHDLLYGGVSLSISLNLKLAPVTYATQKWPIASEEELTINIYVKNIKWTSRTIFSLDRNDRNKPKKLGNHKFDEYYRRPFSNQTFDFVQLTKCYCEFDYVRLPNPIVGSIRYAENKGPRDWQKVFPISSFRHIEVLFHISYYDWGKENRSL